MWMWPLKSAPRPATDSEQGSPVVGEGSLVFWACRRHPGQRFPEHRSDSSSGWSLKSFILKSMLTGDDMMETGPLNWLCALSPLSLSPLPHLFVPSLSLPSISSPSIPHSPFFFLSSPPSLLLYSSPGCVEHKMSDYFPADTALCDRGLELYITGWHSPPPPSAPSLTLSLSQTTSNIAGPFCSLKRLVLGKKPVLKQKQTKCFICHVCQRAICAAQQLFFLSERW